MRIIIACMLVAMLSGCSLWETEKHYVKTGEVKWPGGWSDKSANDGYGKQNKDRYGFIVPLLILGLLSPRRTVNPLALK